MPEKYVVPQFIDVEDKILGPITVRQFVIMLMTALLIFVLYKIFQFGIFLAVAIPLFAAGMVIAFVKINGQPFHFFLLNLFQTWRRPKLRIWDKDLSIEQLRSLLRAPPVAIKLVTARKESLVMSKLSELALVVNTGGVYRPEDYA